MIFVEFSLVANHILMILRTTHPYILYKLSTRIGWLFLFAVLMAAGLLFTMVFFVRVLIFGFCDFTDIIVFL